MKKTELENIHKILSDCLYEFRIGYSDYKNGSNAKIRKEGERKMDSSISLAERWILNNREIYEIASGGNNRSEFDRAIYIEETFRINYFSRDMEEILKELKKIIDSIEE
ncbi:MAG: hypothetical protein ACN6OB_08660 [Chryseobacterium jejuense]|uniref:hypothetical protein n=1 Tax=Chryseobacterium jejuense TaxID=445960 RepID=UPI003D0A4456